MKSFLGLAVLLLVTGHVVFAADDYTLGPDSQPQAGVPTGRVEGPFLFKSQVFTNTLREAWYSATALERAAKDHANRKQIQFSFEGTTKHVSFRRVGTNPVATIDFFSGFGQPCFTADIDQSGQVLTNSLGIAICGIGRH